jgi:hypothetical protein
MSQVSVLVPNLNGDAYLGQCLTSVLAQTFTDWNVVVGDNASTDESVSIVTAMGDGRIRLVHRATTISWVANVNALLSEASDSEYIAVLHADDWWEPTFLQTLVARLEAAPPSLLATCSARIIRLGAGPGFSGLHQGWNARVSTCPSAVATRLLVQKNWLRSPAVLARRSLYQRFPRFDESLPLVNDWLMWIRAATAGDIEVCEQPLANYRFHAQNMSAASTRQNLWGDEMMRMARILQTEWVAREPFPGACRAMAAGVASEILADAGVRAERGDTAGALLQARRARSIAPGLKQRLLAIAGEEAIRVTDLPGLRLARRPAARVGRRLWSVLRPAA